MENRIAWSLNNKTLNSEIETHQVKSPMRSEQALNNKTLNSEIETLRRQSRRNRRIYALNNKTLNSEIETGFRFLWRSRSFELSITRLSILRLKLYHRLAISEIEVIPLNNKTLNSEIETIL